jgi:peptidoglycan hydrolase-like protein with peptidoglycan-binding domain
MRYQVRQGESPTLIARQYGIPFDALINANPHKPTTMVNGRRTWQNIAHDEHINVPVRSGVHGLGAIAPSSPTAPHALIKKGSVNGDVALAQKLLGITVDGDFGPNTDKAVRAFQAAHGLSVDGVIGQNTWPVLLGSGGVVSPPVSAATMPSVSSAAASAAVALAALGADPNYCTSVAKSGTAVNTAVHNFKAAWNAANPSNPVPIGTGKYEPVVASALSSALGGIPVPPGCGAVAAPVPTPSMPAIPAMPPSLPSLPPMPAPSILPAPSAPVPQVVIPSAVQALTAFNPCDQANVAFVRQAQSALKVPVDGKYGNDTAAAAQRIFPGAPAGCSPRPAWWTAPGSGNGGPVIHPPAPTPPAPTPPAPAPPAPTPPAPTPGPVVVAPEEKKGLSTGAMVAGAVGLAALVGVVAMAASGGKSKGGGTRRRSSSRKSSARRKPAHKKSSPKRKPSHRKKK